MKSQDLIKYHQQTIDQLQAEVKKLEGEFIDAKMQITLNQEKNLHLAKNIRQDIARLKTIIRHKQLTGDQKPAVKPTKPAPQKKTTPKESIKTTSKPKSNNNTKKEK